MASEQSSKLNATYVRITVGFGQPQASTAKNHDHHPDQQIVIAIVSPSDNHTTAQEKNLE
jgi:hypothetical protein